MTEINRATIAQILMEVEDIARVYEATSEMHISPEQCAQHMAAKARGIVKRYGSDHNEGDK